MTKGICDTLGLPYLEDIIKENEEENQDNDFEQDAEATELANLLGSTDMNTGSNSLEGLDHANSTEKLYNETLRHAQDIMDLGFNVDTRSAARMFETSAQLYNLALNAKNSKRDAQLKAMQLELNKKKLELEEMKVKGTIPQTIDTTAVVVEDRNVLLKKIKEKKAQDSGN